MKDSLKDLKRLGKGTEAPPTRDLEYLMISTGKIETRGVSKKAPKKAKKEETKTEETKEGQK